MADSQQTEVTGSGQSQVLTVGLLQTAPVYGAVESNIARIATMREEAGDVDLVLTPELALNGYGFDSGAGLRALAYDDARLDSLITGDAVVGLGFAQANNGHHPRNAYLLADPQTGQQDIQHKLHPVSYAPWNEHHTFDAGDALQTRLVRGARCATVICNDMWHPVVPWLAAQAGAEVLIVPVASIEGADPDGIQHTWQVILEHTALMLQCYVVFINRCGTDSGARFWGGSKVLGPDGTVIASAGESEAVLTAALDLAALRQLRADVPILAESRTQFVLDTLTDRGLVPARTGIGNV